MSNNNRDAHKIFAQEIMKSQGKDVQRWAIQNENTLLKKLAQEVIEAVGDVNNSKKTQDMADDAEKGRN